MSLNPTDLAKKLHELRTTRTPFDRTNKPAATCREEALLLFIEQDYLEGVQFLINEGHFHNAHFRLALERRNVKILRLVKPFLYLPTLFNVFVANRLINSDYRTRTINTQSQCTIQSLFKAYLDLIRNWNIDSLRVFIDKIFINYNVDKNSPLVVNKTIKEMIYTSDSRINIIWLHTIINSDNGYEYIFSILTPDRLKRCLQSIIDYIPISDIDSLIDYDPCTFDLLELDHACEWIFATGNESYLSRLPNVSKRRCMVIALKMGAFNYIARHINDSDLGINANYHDCSDYEVRLQLLVLNVGMPIYPLAIAIAYNHTACAELLLHMGANLSMFSSDYLLSCSLTQYSSRRSLNVDDSYSHSNSTFSFLLNHNLSLYTVSELYTVSDSISEFGDNIYMSNAALHLLAFRKSDPNSIHDFTKLQMHCVNAGIDIETISEFLRNHDTTKSY